MNDTISKESLFTMTTAADEIEDKIREIRISNEKLETEKAELEAKLASLWKNWLSDSFFSYCRIWEGIKRTYLLYSFVRIVRFL